MSARIGWLAIGAAVGLCVAPTFAQENGSLSDALAFIQRSITAQGQLSQTDQIRDSSNNQAWVENWTMLYENADYDTAACTLKFHAEFTNNGKSTFSGDLTYALGDVDQAQVLTRDENMNLNNALAGHPTWTVQTSPPASDVQITFKDGHRGGFYIRDADVAVRTARAIQRVAALCGAPR